MHTITTTSQKNKTMAKRIDKETTLKALYEKADGVPHTWIDKPVFEQQLTRHNWQRTLRRACDFWGVEIAYKS